MGYGFIRVWGRLPELAVYQVVYVRAVNCSVRRARVFICRNITRERGKGVSPPYQSPLSATKSPLCGALGLSRPASGRARYGFLPFSPSGRFPAACPGLP